MSKAPTKREINELFPLGLPPLRDTLDDFVQENLLHPENLPIHKLNSSQRFLPAETCVDNLYELDVSPMPVNLVMVRDHKTGALQSFKEELIDPSHADKLSMQRIAQPGVDIRGKNIPFWPGGFDKDESLHEVNLLTEKPKLDFATDLLTIPPNFSRGVNFSEDTPSHLTSNNKPKPQNEVIDLTNLLQFEEDDNFDWAVDQNTPSANEIKDDNKETLDNINENEDTNDIDSVVETTLPPVSSTSLTNSQETEINWYEMVKSNVPVPDFYARIPNMAHTWPFELDSFQKHAILHLERNENVFVAAHTSAGKTVVAEYAIALSLNHLTRSIYTSPIKALSNQKFRDFRQTFSDSNIGLVTGDVQINTTAPCLIMTTEILRSMLYHGSEVLRDLEWVIFDEVHYINDTERGVVWEEVLIMLPPHVNIVLLSATVPNTKEFASWVGKTKKKKIYVVSTLKRPVPLEHHIYTGNSDKTSKELFMVVNSAGEFQDTGYMKAVNAKKERETKSSSSYGPRGHRDGPPQQDRATWLSLIKMLQKTDRLPAVAFIFSKKKIDDNSASLTSIDLTTNKEKSAIHSFIQTSISRLKPVDRLLPQVTKMEDLLKRGLGIHHSGILPILKEVVELLFQRGLVKILFATETFAMGVNMPARTVLFDNLRKHDGMRLRPLDTAEYIQMAGRAGRRGIDTTGTVIIMCKGDVIKSADLHHIILGRPTKLESRFRLTYSMILNLCRVEQLRMEDMMKRSFTEFHAQSDHVKHRVEIADLQTQIENLNEIRCFSCVVDLEDYYRNCRAFCESRQTLQSVFLHDGIMERILISGRVITIQVDETTDYIAVILTTWRQRSKEACIYSVLALIDPQKHSSLTKEELQNIPFTDDSVPIIKRSIYKPDGAAFCKIFDCGKDCISDVTNIMIKLDASMLANIKRDLEMRQMDRFKDNLPFPVTTSVLSQLTRLLDYPLSLCDPVKDAKLQEVDVVELHQSQKNLSRQLETYRCVKCPHFHDHFLEMHKQQVLKTKYNRLLFLLSDDSLSLLPEYTNRVEVLKHLQFLDASGHIQLKGRVACELNSCNLLMSQIIFENLLEGLGPAEIAALLSCVVFKDRKCQNQELTESLQMAQESVETIVSQLTEIQKKCNMKFERDDYDLQVNFGIMQVVYEWARGLPFKDITELTDVQEGIIVRTIQRLHEVLRDVKDAARLIGNPTLFEKMNEAGSLIKRDIVFAASLYTQ